MKDKVIEAIRQLLIKTVLPYRRKKEKFLSQFHFSISFRIALNYVKLFVVYGVVFFALVIAVFLAVEVKEAKNLIDNEVERLSSDNIKILSPTELEKAGITTQYELYYYDTIPLLEEKDDNILKEYNKYAYRQVINPYWNNGLSIEIKDHDSKVLYYSDIIENVKEDTSWAKECSYNYSGNGQLFFKFNRNFVSQGQEFDLYIQCNLTSELQVLKEFIGILIFLYIIFVIFVAKFGKSGIERLFKPLQDISDTANRLTVNNLHSERLNVEGTKNELKELATTINKMLDRIELSYESQKQFVSDASHELRTPIAVIQGYANMLDRWGSKDEEVLEESIVAIKCEAQSMKDLVEKLLFLSRHDKKTLKLKKTRFNMRLVVEEMLKETILVTKDREISSKILEDVEVYGDKQALKQALRIFIDNAIKYSKDGDSIWISCKNDNGTCLVSVEDTGIGMKKEDAQKIFDRFYRCDSVRNKKISGHGLGLSIAKLIILKHTGSIKVRTQYGKGSCFTIILPDYYKQGFFK